MTGINGIDTARAVRAMDEEAVLIFVSGQGGGRRQYGGIVD